MAGILFMGHDGSYMVELDPNICSATYIIKCTATGNDVIGSVVERSDAADNYRAKILGVLMFDVTTGSTFNNTDKYLPYQEVEFFVITEVLSCTAIHPKPSYPRNKLKLMCCGY